MKKTRESSFTIRQVIDLTGVSEYTLRGWENRYAAVKPYRSETGRRLYSQADILKIKVLKDLVNRGHRIGEIAGQSVKVLQTLLEKRSLLEVSIKNPSINLKITRIVALILQQADQHQWNEVRKIILNKKNALPSRDFILILVVQLLNEIGRQAELGQVSIIQEHILTSLVKESLFSISSKIDSKGKNGMRLVMCSPEGDFHELGLLIASVLSRLAGIETLFLGANMPKVEICEVCIRYKATHLLLASTLSKKEGAKEDLFQYINFIDRQIPTSVALWIAGRNGVKTQVELKRDLKILSSLVEFDQLISETR